MWQEVLDALQKTNSNNFVKNQTASLSEQHNCAQPILPNTWAQCEYICHLLSSAFFLKIHSLQMSRPHLPLCNKAQYSLGIWTCFMQHESTASVSLYSNWDWLTLYCFSGKALTIWALTHYKKSPPSNFWTGHEQCAHTNTNIYVYMHIRTYAYLSKAGWFVDKWGIGKKNYSKGICLCHVWTSAFHKQWEKSINALHWQKNPKHVHASVIL